MKALPNRRIAHKTRKSKPLAVYYSQNAVRRFENIIDISRFQRLWKRSRHNRRSTEVYGEREDPPSGGAKRRSEGIWHRMGAKWQRSVCRAKYMVKYSSEIPIATDARSMIIGSTLLFHVLETDTLSLLA